MVIANFDGTAVVDGYTLPLDTDNNGIYDFRQPGEQIEITKHPDDVVINKACLDSTDDTPFFNVVTDNYYTTYTWQISYDNGITWQKIRDLENFIGYNTDTLKIISASASLNGALFRAIVEDKAFICGVPDTSNVATISLLPDNDLDCITDEDDLDDDNDGILDTDEDTTDIDNDGIPNHFDLDADGDLDLFWNQEVTGVTLAATKCLVPPLLVLGVRAVAKTMRDGQEYVRANLKLVPPQKD